MALLTTGFKTAAIMGTGLHTVRLARISETDPTTRVFANGDSRDYKATLKLHLASTNGAIGTHTFYYDTYPVHDPETGINHPAIVPEDAERLTIILDYIRQQVNNPEYGALEELAKKAEWLINNRTTFEVLVTETPSEDGQQLWKNFTYSPQVIQNYKLSARAR